MVVLLLLFIANVITKQHGSIKQDIITVTVMDYFPRGYNIDTMLDMMWSHVVVSVNFTEE